MTELLETCTIADFINFCWFFGQIWPFSRTFQIQKFQIAILCSTSIHNTKQNHFSHRKYSHLPEQAISKLFTKIKHFKLLHCEILTHFGHFRVFDQSSIVMLRLKYYNFTADIKYDLGLSIQHWNQYNDDIRWIIWIMI